jgi:hypothetical protein
MRCAHQIPNGQSNNKPKHIPNHTGSVLVADDKPYWVSDSGPKFVSIDIANGQLIEVSVYNTDEGALHCPEYIAIEGPNDIAVHVCYRLQ